MGFDYIPPKIQIIWDGMQKIRIRFLRAIFISFNGKAQRPKSDFKITVTANQELTWGTKIHRNYASLKFTLLVGGWGVLQPKNQLPLFLK